jgi:hypothetical protein
MDNANLVETLKRALSQNLQSPQASFPGQSDFSFHLPQYVPLPHGIKDELLSHFNSDDSLSAFDHRVLNTGLGGSLVTYDILTQWIVEKAIKNGPEQAVHALEQYIASPFTPGYEILALSGVEITRRHRIISDIELIPFAELPSSYAKNNLDPQFPRPELLISLGLPPFPEMSYRHEPPKAALIRPIKISPKSFSQDHVVSRIPRWDMQLFQVCECLTLIGPSAPLPRAHWTEVDQDVPCYGWLGGGHSAPNFDVILGQVYTYRESDLAEMHILIEEFLQLDQSMKDQLRVPLERMNQALRRSDPRSGITDKAIDLGIALESLLLKDRSSNDPVSFPFRLRAAWLLGNDSETRLRFMSIFKSLYNLRSDAVHTGSVDSKVKVQGRRVETKYFLNEGIDLCGQVIRKIISDQKFPDWDKLVLGA